jgi:hypothetical protein
METLDDIRAHQRMERGKKGKVGSWKVESLYELQGGFIKDGKVTSLGWNFQAS